MEKRRALISVSDKTGVVEFASKLADLGFEIISTGGTEKALKKAGLKPVNISDITGFPECLDGRVKTLHPAVHAGLLARRDIPEHMETLEKLGIGKIDVVAVNLYPFKATVEKPGVTLEEAIENIDIGGPTMIRSAAKNYPGVLVVVDPADYDEVIERIKNDTADNDFRFMLSYKVFRHTSVYDTMIANYMQKKLGIEFPDQITFAYEKKQDMRYGENPHQKGAWYSEIFAKDVAGTLSSARQLQGKELSYNNVNDCGGALGARNNFLSLGTACLGDLCLGRPHACLLRLSARSAAYVQKCALSADREPNLRTDWRRCRRICRHGNRLRYGNVFGLRCASN